jgi:16S rRNA processing protein RimM
MTKKIFLQKKKIFIAKVNSSKNIETSRNLIGEELLADKNNFPECKKNDFFYSDLEKCNVFDLNNKLIGKISGIFNFGAGDILEIKINEDNSTMLMNFNKYNFPKISIKKKSITLNIT